MTGIDTACAAFDDDLSAWIDGELAAGRASGLSAHVERCVHCAGRAAALREVDQALRAIPAPAVSADLALRLRERLQAEPQGAAADAVAPGPSQLREPAPHRLAAPRERRRWALPVGIAAAAAAALAVLALRPALRDVDPVVPAAGPALRAEQAPPESIPLLPPLPRAGEVGPQLSARPGVPLGASAPEEPPAEASPELLRRQLEAASDAELAYVLEREGAGAAEAAERRPPRERLHSLSAAERGEALARLGRLRALPPAEQERLLRESAAR